MSDVLFRNGAYRGRRSSLGTLFMATSRTLADPPLHPHRHPCVLAAAILLVTMVFLPLTAVAQAQTSTSLTIQPSNPTAGQVVTHTATVTVGSSPVTVGTVTFKSGTQVLGTVQVVGTDASGFTPGTATLKLGFAPGTYSVTAYYNSNTQFQGSQSGPQQLTVTGTEPTNTTLIPTLDGSNYDFAAWVFGYGLPLPTGMVSLTEVSTGINLGSLELGPPGMGTPNYFFLVPPLVTSPPPTFPAGSRPIAIAIGDFNGDGCPDLAVADQNISTSLPSVVSILLGEFDAVHQTCTGMFLPPVPYQVGKFPEAIALGDFNGDGTLDLAVSCYDTSSIAVLYGKGDGTFTEPATSLSPTNAPDAIAVADFNGDGLPDIATADEQGGAVSVFTNKNGTGFNNPIISQDIGGVTPTGIAVGDFDGDGCLDLAVVYSGSNNVGILLNPPSTCTGALNQQMPLVDVGNGPQQIVTGDFRGMGNGCLDLAVTNYNDDTVGILLGKCDGSGAFQPVSATGVVGTSPEGIAIADFDHDGCLDLAVSNQGSNDIAVLLGEKTTQGACTGTFQLGQPTSYPVGQTPSGIAVADFLGNGTYDLAVANFFSDNVTVLTNGAVTTGTLTNIPVPGPGQQTINANYAPDLNFYAASQGSAQVSGNGLIPTTTTLNSSQNPSHLNQSVIFTAGVTTLPGGMPTGTVIFTSDSQPISGCNPVNLVNGQAACTTSTLPLGTHAIVAMYSGDSNFATSSGQLSQQVQIATTTTVSSSPNPSQLDQPVTFTASVTASGGGMPTGTVIFTSDGGPISECAAPVNLVNGQATCTTSTLPLGTHIIAAMYSGDSNFAPSSGQLSQQVLAGGKLTPTVNLMASPNPVNFGSNEYFVAQVQSVGGLTPTGTVTFAEGTIVLATANVGMNGQANYTNNTLVLGPHTITATYNGDNNFNPASGTVVLQVNTAFTLTGNMSSGTVTPPQPATFTVTVDAAWQTTPLIYAVMTCSAPAGLTCSVACPPSPSHPSGLTNLCVVTGLNQPASSMATVTVDTSGLARLNRPLRQREQRVMAAWAGFGGFGLVGLVFVPVKLRRKTTATFLFLLMVVLCFGIGCTAFAPGTSSSPVNNTFNIKVTANLLEENPLASTGYNNLGLQVFWYELLIK